MPERAVHIWRSPAGYCVLPEPVVGIAISICDQVEGNPEAEEEADST